MKFCVALSYFDVVIGPRIFYSYPDHILDKKNVNELEDIMTPIRKEGFYYFYCDNFFSLNYYFEITSTWARGNRECLMFSTIFFERPSVEIEKAILPISIEFAEGIKSKANIFTAFYKGSRKYDDKEEFMDKINTNNLLVLSRIKQYYNKIAKEVQDNIENEKLKSLLDREDVLNTLKLISDGPKPLAHLKNWYKQTYPKQNFYTLLYMLLRSQVLSIPKLMEKEAPPYEVLISDDINIIITLKILNKRSLNRFIEKQKASEQITMPKDSESLQKHLEKKLPKTPTT